MKKLNAMEEKLDLATSDNSANNAALGRAKEAWEKEKAALLESTEKVRVLTGGVWAWGISILRSCS